MKEGTMDGRRGKSKPQPVNNIKDNIFMKNIKNDWWTVINKTRWLVDKPLMMMGINGLYFG